MISPPLGAAQSTSRVSVNSSGVQGNNQSGGSTFLSADGRYVAFGSDASNLVPGDINAVADVFVHDRITGQTHRVSVDSAGLEGNATSYVPTLSADGRLIAFHSEANNLVAGDTNGVQDIFVHDRSTGQTRRVSQNIFGLQGDRPSEWPFFSADGRFVAFSSRATNLVAGDTNNTNDVFVANLQTGEIYRASVDSSGVQGNRICGWPTISATGRFIAFYGSATNLVPGDTNGKDDAFVHDRATGITTRVSVDSAGFQGNALSAWASVSDDGRFAAYHSDATNLVSGDTNGQADVFVHDLLLGLPQRVSVSSLGAQGNAGSFAALISADGRFVAFDSWASSLVPGDFNGTRDVFIHELAAGTTTIVSVSTQGAPGNNFSFDSFVSPDGRFVAFPSYASTLVPGDTNGAWDIFVRDRGAPLRLAGTGTCPGPVRLRIAGATAVGWIAMIYGPAGIRTKPGQPCQGMTLGISPPELRRYLRADAAGTVEFVTTVSPAACGVTLQVVDVTTCTASNTIVF